MKRFTDTALNRKAWFRKLSPKMKCAWRFICDECDSAGVWSIDMEAMSFYVGEPIEFQDLIDAFTNDKATRVIELEDDKLFIPGFIDFQYGTLSETCKPHIKVIERLKKLRLWEGYAKGIQTLEEEEEEEEEEKGGVGENKPAPKLHPLAELWNAGVSNTRLPKVASFSRNGRRFKSAQARWEENSDPNFWVGVIQRVTQSRFCLGENDRKWKANFDWLIRPDSASKILEGVYDNRGSDERKSWLAEQAAKDSA